MNKNKIRGILKKIKIQHIEEKRKYFGEYVGKIGFNFEPFSTSRLLANSMVQVGCLYNDCTFLKSCEI